MHIDDVIFIMSKLLASDRAKVMMSSIPSMLTFNQDLSFKFHTVSRIVGHKFRTLFDGTVSPNCCQQKFIRSAECTVFIIRSTWFDFCPDILKKKSDNFHIIWLFSVHLRCLCWGRHNAETLFFKTLSFYFSLWKTTQHVLSS